MPGAIVDTGALLQVVWVSLVAAVGLAVAFTGGVLLASDAAGAPVRRAAGVGLFALCGLAVGAGLYVMFALK